MIVFALGRLNDRKRQCRTWRHDYDDDVTVGETLPSIFVIFSILWILQAEINFMRTDFFFLASRSVWMHKTKGKTENTTLINPLSNLEF